MDAPTGPSMILVPGGGNPGCHTVLPIHRATRCVTTTRRFHALVPSPAAAQGTGHCEGDLLGTDGTEGEPALVLGAAAPKDPEELFRAAYPRLAGWVRRLVDDDDTAHEIASEAFVRLLGRWTKVENPQSYLYMIATNLVRDHWRKTERERRAIRTVIADEAEPKLAYPAQDVDVRNLLEALPARLRDPFLLHYYAGFPLKEVATLLHRPEGTIKADLYAARAKLKTALGDRS
ncbi:MAG TPA: RNA polymerase sigma factor [Streptosporangiaceae bacterium]|nr:RNA polymerase sigma factor [Streptosporangiaceae bacterium]